MQQQQDPKELLDLEAIEAALVLIPVFPTYFNDMRLLVAEVRRLRARTDAQAAELAGYYSCFERLLTTNVEEEIEGIPV